MARTTILTVDAATRARWVRALYDASRGLNMFDAVGAQELAGLTGAMPGECQPRMDIDAKHARLYSPLWWGVDRG